MLFIGRALIISISSDEDGAVGSTTTDGTGVGTSFDEAMARFFLVLFVKLLRADVDGRRDRRSFRAIDDSSGISSSVLLFEAAVIDVCNDEPSCSVAVGDADEIGGGDDDPDAVTDASVGESFSGAVSTKG